MSGCPWCGYTGSGHDEEHVAHRIDPRGCGCTDCLCRWSVPLDDAREYELHLMRRGVVDNATGQVPPWNPELEARNP